jgi:hypothetical protein
MHRSLVSLAVLSAALLAAAGCTTAPTTATKLEPKIQAKVQKGIVEPGFTPEMVYLALGKPTEPSQSLADATTNGTWVYTNFQPKEDRGLVKAGFRTRVVADGGGKDKVVTEPLTANASPTLAANTVAIIFREGRVVEIQRR